MLSLGRQWKYGLWTVVLCVVTQRFSWERASTATLSNIRQKAL